MNCFHRYVSQISFEQRMLIRMALRGFVAGCVPRSLIAFLGSAGFVTSFVVANGVDSGDEFAESLGVPVSLSLQALWVACDRHAELTAVAASRASSVVAPLTVPPEAPPTSAATSSSFLVAASSRKRTATVGSERSWVAAYQRKENVRATPKRQLLWKAFRKLGPAERLWRVENQKLTKERLQAFSTSCLSFGLWLEARSVSEQPSPLHVALWLRECGASCADRRVQCILFAALAGRPLGFLVPHQKSNGYCMGASRAGPRGNAKGTLPFAPSSLARLESYALSAAGPRRVLLAVWLVVLGGVLRFAHVQRSHLSLLPGVLVGKASLGKVKVRGARRPFSWQVSSLGLTGDLQTALQGSCLAAGPAERGRTARLYGRELGLPRAPAPGSMSLSRFHFLSGLLFQETGWTDVQCAQTLAICPQTLLDWGGWAGSPSASLPGACARRLRMPMRYSGVQVETGVVVREYVFRMVHPAMDSGKILSSWAVLPAAFPELLGVRVRFFLHIILRCCWACFVAVVCRGFLHFFRERGSVSWSSAVGSAPLAEAALYCKVKPGNLSSVAGVGCACARLTGRVVCQRCLAAYRDM